MWRTGQGDAVEDQFKVGAAQGNTKGQAAPILRVFVPQLSSRSYAGRAHCSPKVMPPFEQVRVWRAVPPLLRDRPTRALASQVLAVVHTDPPTSVFTHWPMVLFPAYLVPFSIILHITAIRVLLANRRSARDEHTSVATSAMTASG